MRAAAIAEALGGHRSGDGWMARCPAHDDRTPSLSIGEIQGRPWVHCFAGCARDSVLSALRTRGLWSADGGRSAAAGDKGRHALQIWNESRPAERTLVQTYLLSRRIHLEPPSALRFHPGLKHSPTGATWPAMVALVTSAIDAEPIAIHRTYLAADGRGKAPVTPAKMMLGPCRGGVVRLGPAAGTIMVGEGIETCLAAMAHSRHPAWAALSAAGLARLALPKEVRSVIVLADLDPAGEGAAALCGRRWKQEGRRVRIARPPRGNDFNDALEGAA